MSKARIIQEAAEKAAAAEVDRTRLLLARAEKFSAWIVGYDPRLRDTA